jgi:hypothetical protein
VHCDPPSDKSGSLRLDLIAKSNQFSPVGVGDVNQEQGYDTGAIGCNEFCQLCGVVRLGAINNPMLWVKNGWGSSRLAAVANRGARFSHDES